MIKKGLDCRAAALEGYRPVRLRGAREGPAHRHAAVGRPRRWVRPV